MLRRPFPYRATLTLTLLCALVLGLALAVVPGSPAAATPPGIPHKSTAQAELDALRVVPESSMSGYTRELFPHWVTSGGCTARQTVLRRDGVDVVVNASCQPTSGRWYSPYDNLTLYVPSDVDIDHVVALGEAWRSGARAWTGDRRRSFANDLGGPQLRAVSASSNRSKGDHDPAGWKPRAAYHCTYSKMWIRTKHRWGLSVDPAERSVLQAMLHTC